MAAGQVASHTNLNANSASMKRYSFLDDLENLHLASPELSFPPASSSRRVDDETVRRLSTSLQNLLSQKHGSHQLPELPIPSYDNGNIDLGPTQTESWSHPEAPLDTCPEPLHHDTQSMSCTSNSVPAISRVVPRLKAPLLQRQTSLKTSDQDSGRGDSIERSSYTQISHIQHHIDSPRVSCYSNVGRGSRQSQTSSSHTSRPSSMTGPTVTRRVKSCSRPGPALLQPSHARRHKKSTSNTDHKYNPVGQPESPKSQVRRRFRLMPSLKDLHAQAKSQAKRLTIEHKPPVQDHADPVASQLISLHDALRGSVMPLSPLHDPSQDQQFTKECERMLELRPDSRQRSIRRKLAPRNASVPQDVDFTGGKANPTFRRHHSTVSDAPTVGSSILDLEWPQPNTYTALNPEVYQRQRMANISARSACAVQSGDRKNLLVPSPPPTYPLPPVPPKKQTSVRKYGHKRSATHTVTDSPTDVMLKSHSLAGTINPSSKRITALAASRGLQIDANLRGDGTSRCQPLEVPVSDPLPSPLNARFNQSQRNSKVHELKKRHLSMLVKDVTDPPAFNTRPEKPARPESYPAEIPTSIYSPRSVSTTSKPTLRQKRTPVPMVPGSARYHETSQCPTSVTKANIGKSRNVRHTTCSSMHRDRQAIELGHDRPLAHSGVMVMVDSSPRQSHDFRAGAIKVTASPRRKASVSTKYTIAPLRYQSGLRKRGQTSPSKSRPASGQGIDSVSVNRLQIQTPPRQMSSDFIVDFVTPRRASGLQSPSKASSILEPTLVKEPQTPQIPPRRRDIGQYQASMEGPLTPIWHVNDKEYVLSDRPASTSNQHPFDRADPASRQSELDRLHAEIDRMVRSRRDSNARKDTKRGKKHSFIDRVGSERTKMPGFRSLSKKASCSMSSHDMISQIDAVAWLAKTLSPTTTFGDTYDGSDQSITPKSSFQSSSSESSSKYRRRNSDASLTDPNDYDAAKPRITMSSSSSSSSSGRIYIMPSPTLPEEEFFEITSTKPKKKYSNILTRMSSSRTVDNLNSNLNYSYVSSHQLVTLPVRCHTSPLDIPEDEELDFSSSASIPRSPSAIASTDGIELNHFLTEADQMDNAIESFIQSQSSWSVDREPIPGIPKRSMLSRDNRRSAVSNVVDLQRIQDQVNGKKEFGRISLITRPRTT